MAIQARHFKDFVRGTPPLSPSSPSSPTMESAPRGRQTPTLGLADKPTGRRSVALKRPERAFKRWDGLTGRCVPWDSLRRDAELYDQAATCAVHFHSNGNSQRGPSLKVPLSIVSKSGCLSSLQHLSVPSGSESPTSDSGYSSIGSHDYTRPLFIAAPECLTRDEALDYHVITRNLFAWMMNKPLVGRSLGQALVDLLERLLTVRRPTMDSVTDCLNYADRMGYTNMNQNPDHALAMLTFAEHFKLTDLWTNAFVHCTGMNGILCQSGELNYLPVQMQAAITMASLKMDLAYAKVRRNLSNFLEDEASPLHLGLTPSQRSHLDRFRSFIHSFYVSSLGYWPPPQITQELLCKMRRDFSALYTLLADKDSFHDVQNTVSGGLCVLQNVRTFDERHSYRQQPHPLPLIPQNGPLNGRSFHSRGIRSMLGSGTLQKQLVAATCAGLRLATNKVTSEVRNCFMVQAYLSFEQDSVRHLEADLSIGDARKVRWIQIYYTLQMLTSVTTTPKQFVPGGNGTVNYPTTCTVPSIPWSSGRASLLSIHPALRPQTPPNRSPVLPSPGDVEPDCSRDDYFEQRPYHTRQDSAVSLTSLQLRLPTPPSLARATSILARRASQLSSPPPPPQTPIPTRRPSGFPTPSDDAATDTSVSHELPAGARTPTLDIDALVDMDAMTALASLPSHMGHAFGPFELEAVEVASGRDEMTWFDDAASEVVEVFEMEAVVVGRSVFDATDDETGEGTDDETEEEDEGEAGEEREEEEEDEDETHEGEEDEDNDEENASTLSFTSAYSDASTVRSRSGSSRNSIASSHGTQATLLTPTTESPRRTGGSERWAGAYRECCDSKGEEEEEDYFWRLEERVDDAVGVWADAVRGRALRR